MSNKFKDLINIDILKEVLSNNENFKNFKIKKIKKIKNNVIEFEYRFNGINIYKLNLSDYYFICKQYALDKGYIVDTCIRGYCSGKALGIIYNDDWTSEFSEYYIESFGGESEIEVILKVVKWIYEKNV